jgi:hypothetical protein
MATKADFNAEQEIAFPFCGSLNVKEAFQFLERPLSNRPKADVRRRTKAAESATVAVYRSA